MSFNIPSSPKKRVVIVGGGFGGLQAAKALNGSERFQVVLIDRNNYHQFPPLIYQVAAAGLEADSIAFPFRKLFQRQKDFYFRMATARAVVPEQKILQTSIGEIRYDYLVLAAGCTTHFFGNARVEAEAIPMKTLSEAMGLRNALLGNFERALTSSDEQERKELLNIVIVGGGATGVEVAGALAEMKRYVLPKDYPEIDLTEVNICLIEAGSRLLAAMDEASSRNAERYLRSMGVDIRLNTTVTGHRDHRVELKDGTRIATRTFIWVSGILAQPIGNIGPEQTGRGGRIRVDAFNAVTGWNNVFAIGDQCLMTADAAWPDGHPQLAQAAIQQGKALAQNLLRLEKGEKPRPFAYKNLGVMATIGRNRAVAEFGRAKIHGFAAWMLWMGVHLIGILGVRNKSVVLLDWIWNYFSYAQSLRMIVYARKAGVVKEREEHLASQQGKNSPGSEGAS